MNKTTRTPRMTPKTPRGNMNLPRHTAEEQPLFTDKWRHTTNKHGKQEIATVGIPPAFAKKLENWKTELVVEGKIKTSSKYNTYRYATMVGITLIDQLMTAKYGKKEEDE